MTKSEFQFSDPSLTNFVYSINKDYYDADAKVNKLDLPIESSVEIKTKEVRDNSALVELTITIAEQTKIFPFFISATASAVFRWPSNMSKEMSDQLLNTNAPALLLSYLRPIIAQISDAGPFDALHLPFMNFMDKDEPTV